MPRSFNQLLTGYFMLALLIAPIHLLSFDSYYYWEWSRHLDWAYFDGSPLIAYFIRVFTYALGDNLSALSALAVVTTIATCVILYRTARLFLDRDASRITVCLWLFSPLITLDLLNQVTLNTPLTLFWVLTLYYSIRYLIKENRRDLYWVGLNTGLMLLSKYSGIVLVLGLLACLFLPANRRLFLSPTLYLAALFALLLFSPVIIWNGLHDWQSFHYQLHTHARTCFSLSAMLKTTFTVVLSSLNFMLLPLYTYRKHNKQLLSIPAHCCFILSACFLGFYLIVAGWAKLRGFWLSQYLLTAALLAGYCYQQDHSRTMYRVLIAVYGFISVLILINATTLFNVFHTQKVAYFHAIQQFNRMHVKAPEVILTSGWMQARLLFFLKNHPPIYTVECGEPQNQYASWSKALVTRLTAKQIQRAWYVDIADHSACIKPYFDTCQPLTTDSLLVSYACHN